MFTPDKYTENAAAKVNLCLQVTGRRTDGYHLLQSLVVFANVGEYVEVSMADSLSLNYTGSFADALPSSADNLVMQAARELQMLASTNSGAAITLHKKMPVESGIGGGSADAAATLRALMQLWGAPLSTTDLNRLALSLGADVPVCLTSQAVWMEGVGEIITPVALPTLYLLLVNPSTPLVTRDVFGQFNSVYAEPATLPQAFDCIETLVDFLQRYDNMLTAAATQLCPEISALLQALEQTEDCLLARMSGSGATCFGLFAHLDGAERAAQSMRHDHPTWWITTASTHGHA